MHERQPKNVTGTEYENKILFRGIIKDRNGKILASNIFTYKLKAYPKLIKNPSLTSEILSTKLKNLEKNRVLKQISNKHKSEVVIARNITAKKAKQLRTSKSRTRKINI